MTETSEMSVPPNNTKGDCSHVTINTTDNVFMKEIPEMSDPPDISKRGCVVVKEEVRNHGQNVPKLGHFSIFESNFHKKVTSINLILSITSP